MNGSTNSFVLALIATLAFALCGLGSVFAFMPETQIPLGITAICGMSVPVLTGIMSILNGREAQRKLDAVSLRVEEVKKQNDGHQTKLEEKIDTLRQERDESRKHADDIVAVVVAAKPSEEPTLVKIVKPDLKEP